MIMSCSCVRLWKNVIMVCLKRHSLDKKCDEWLDISSPGITEYSCIK
jgi:hypothetical protein